MGLQQKLLIGFASTVLAGAVAQAGAATITASTADFTPRAPGNTDGNVSATNVVMTELVSKTAGRVGRGNTTLSELYVIPFQLPVLAAGESINSATLTLNVTGAGNVVTVNANGGTQVLRADLYGLGYRADSTVLATDAYVGASGGSGFDTTDATLLSADFLRGDTDVRATPAISTSAPLVKSTSGNALSTYLNAQYAAGAVGGNFVFLRVNPDELYTGGQYEIATADNATASLRPVLTYEVTAVPEPTALAGVTGLALLALRRNRSRA